MSLEVRKLTTVSEAGEIRVVIPVKNFEEAKQRLSGSLSPTQRAELAKLMAENVIAVCRDLDTAIACDDDDTASWAHKLDLDVIRTDGLDLNGAIGAALADTRSADWKYMAIVHADLPLATSFIDLIGGHAEQVLMVTDRLRDGTNVLVVPTESEFRFKFGPGSFESHLKVTADLGLDVRVIDSACYSWDIDEPVDLIIPRDLVGNPEHLRAYTERGLLQVINSNIDDDPDTSDRPTLTGTEVEHR